MTGIGSFLKALLIPALTSLFLYILLTYLLIPLYRRHHARYNQYLPVGSGLESLSTATTGFRHRASDALFTFFLPSSWSRARYSRHGRVVHGGSSGGMSSSDDDLFDDQEGEDMVGFEIDQRQRRRAQMERQMDRRRAEAGVEERRLSRDLEEGFKDESDEDEEDSRIGSRGR